MSATQRRISIALATLPLLLGVAACGGATSEEPNGSASAGKGGGPSAAAPLTSATFVQRLTAAQAEARTAHLDAKIDAGQAGQIQLSADLRLDPADPAAKMTMSTAMLGQGIEAILLDKVMYLKVPGLSADKPWLKMSLAHGPLAGAGLGAVDTTSMLKGLKGAMSVRSRGQESVDGVATTHYEVRVDAAKALAAQGLHDPSSLGLAGKHTITYDIWVDSDDLIRKIDMDIGSYSMQMTLSDYGEPVQISAPPAGQIGKAPMMNG